MRPIGRFIGKLIWYGFGLALYGLWVLSMFHWLGGIGAFIAVVAFPAAYVFPFVYWIVEGFPLLYLALWACSMVGVGIAYVSRDPWESGKEWLDRHDNPRRSRDRDR
jgi:hypothetical protein